MLGVPADMTCGRTRISHFATLADVQHDLSVEVGNRSRDGFVFADLTLSKEMSTG